MSHDIPSFKEDHISQIPALELLQKLGYEYLSPAEAVALRGGRLAGVLLENVLAEQLRKINVVRFKGREYPFSEGNILAAVQALKDVANDGLVPTNTKAVFAEGSVLYGKLRPNLRKSWYCKFDGVCSTEIWVLQPNSKSCRGRYLAQLVQTERFVSAACVTSGSKMPRADWGFVSEIPFDVPQPKEQDRIAAVLGAVDRGIALLKKMLAALGELKRGLMQKLLSNPAQAINEGVGRHA